MISRVGKYAVVFILLMRVSASMAACTNGVADTCSQADFAECISEASNGDTITIPEGSCSWSTGVTLPDGLDSITVVGAGSENTIITGTSSATLITSYGDGNDISGMNLKAPGTATYVILIRGDGWRVHHNKIESTTSGSKIAGVFARGDSTDPDPTGLVDNNTFIDCYVNSMGSAALLPSDSQNEIYAVDVELGDQNTVYIEDNDFTMADDGNVVDANYASSYVCRFNTFSSPSSGSIIESHSLQSTTNRANRRWEIYGNTLIGVSSKWVPFFIRGGTGVLFGNEIEGSFTNEHIYFDNRRSFSDVGGTAGQCDGSSDWDGNEDSNGWPCRDQIGTGEDTTQWEDSPPSAYTQIKMPAYVWGNDDTSNQELTVSVINSSDIHIQSNRDYYEYTSGFDGTNGVGSGTLANRPSACTTDVAYWATDQGDWNHAASDDNGHGFGQGVLYKCTSTDTWEVYYEPYDYPHPLRSEDTTQPTTQASGNFTMSGN